MERYTVTCSALFRSGGGWDVNASDTIYDGDNGEDARIEFDEADPRDMFLSELEASSIAAMRNRGHEVAWDVDDDDTCWSERIDARSYTYDDYAREFLA